MNPGDMEIEIWHDLDEIELYYKKVNRLVEAVKAYRTDDNNDPWDSSHWDRINQAIADLEEVMSIEEKD